MIHTIIEHIQVVVNQYIPSGLAWNAKSDSSSTMRKLIEGFCTEYQRMEITLDDFLTEMMPDTTTDYIREWEIAVGIPDDCFSVAATIDERRLNVKRKLSLLGLQTRIDFENFASSLGLSVSVRSGIDHLNTVDNGYETHTPTLDIPTDFASLKDARNTIVVTSLESQNAFDYDFDFPFQSAAQSLMECVFSAAKPAHCKIIFVVNP